MSDAGRVPVSVVMITKNEEQAIAQVVDDIRLAAPDAEVLIVDSSEDRTAEIAASLGVRVIRQYPPRGYGPAMDLALRSATGQVVVTLDCDNTYPTQMIPLLAGNVLSGDYDLVDTTRLARRPEAMPWLNYLANAGFAFIASALFWHRLTDLHSGMRAYSRDLILRLRYDPRGAALPVELLLRPIRMGARVKVVPIGYRERTGKSTLRPLQSAWWTLRRILAVRFGR